MASPRKEVVAAVADYLKTPVEGTYPTAASGRVFDTDSTPPDADHLPEINVLFIRESKDASTDHQPGVLGLNSPVRRVMEMQIEVYHVTAESLDVAWQVEEALRVNATLADKVESVRVNDVDLFVAENNTVSLYVSILKVEVAYWTHVTEDTGRPTTVLLGFVPETGPGNEPKYEDITATGLQDMV
ncbi:hypothetical protein LH464_04390 [Neorhizobium sp. T786]|uniref:hypothetical protein n=1 Tax=Pseudorhizobium xiangyangii TaxID=2883104 RepID=UPI001CFFADEC|nr:hypothetical protein [Neorhizobium xiangyangii]MCB5201717.1 hypothetical protein [Neorhizobium xiangyangii]